MKQQNNQSETFVIIYNVLLNKSEYKLTVEEFYFYVLLVHRINLFSKTYETSLDLIYSVQSMFKINKSNKKEVITKIKNFINSLVDKKVLGINIDILGDKVRYDTVFEISQIQLDSKRGFEKLTKSTYDLCDNRYALYIINYMNQFKNKKPEKSLENWRTTLGGISKNTVAKYLKQLCDEGKLYRKEGMKFYGEDGNFTEAPMIYSLTPFEEKGAKTTVDASNASTIGSNHSNSHADESSETVDVEGVKVEKVTDKSKYGNWSKHGANLTDDDYDLYAAHENDEEFTKVVNKKINIISKNRTNEKVVEMYEKYLEEARDRLAADNREKNKELANQHYQQIVSNHETGKYVTFSNTNHLSDQSSIMSIEIGTFANMNLEELKRLEVLYVDFELYDYDKYIETTFPFSSKFNEKEGYIERRSSDIIIKLRDKIIEQMLNDSKLNILELEKYEKDILTTNIETKKNDNSTTISFGKPKPVSSYSFNDFDDEPVFEHDTEELLPF